MTDDARTDASQEPSSTIDGLPSTEGGTASFRSLHLWQIQSVRDVLLIALVAGSVYVGYAMRTVTVPLLIAVALAYLIEPLVVRVARWRRMSRPLAVGLILSGLASLLAIAIAIVVPLAIGQTLSFADSLRSGKYDGFVDRVLAEVPDEYREDARHWTDRIIHPSLKRAPEEATEHDADHVAGVPPASNETRGEKERASSASAETRTETFPQLPSAVTQVSLDNPIVALLGAGAGRVYSIGLTVLQLGLVAFLIPFYFYYFSVHWPAIVGFFGSLVPEERRSKVFEIVAEMDRAVAGFVRGRIVICVIMGVMFAIGWQFCGVPYGLALGILTGAFSIVPYLGGIGLPFAVLLLVADQMGLEPTQRMALWEMLLWPSLVFLVVQTIEGYLLTPVIAGKATNLDPVTIVVAILAGGSIAGIYGMLLAIPIAACGKIAARRLLLPRVKDWASGRVSDPLPINSD